MKTLIAGFGSIGRRHLRNLLTLGEREIVLYRTGHSTLPDFEPGESAELAGGNFSAEDLAGIRVETDLDATLAHHPAAAIIANPTALHLDVAIPAARAGCHLLLEKPVSHSLERLDELQSALDSGGSQVLVGYQFRFHPGLHAAAAALAKGEIGRPVSFRAHWGEYLPGWHPWEDYRQGYSARRDLGGGVALTLSHPIDYVRWLFGDVASLWAIAGYGGGLDLDVEDTLEMGLRMRSGVIGSIHLDYNQRPPRHYLEVIGTLGTLHWESTDSTVAIQSDEAGRQPVGRQASAAIPFERNDLFLAEMRHFIAVVNGTEQPACTLQDGIEALRLGLTASRGGRLEPGA